MLSLGVAVGTAVSAAVGDAVSQLSLMLRQEQPLETLLAQQLA